MTTGLMTTGLMTTDLMTTDLIAVRTGTARLPAAAARTTHVTTPRFAIVLRTAVRATATAVRTVPGGASRTGAFTGHPVQAGQPDDDEASVPALPRRAPVHTDTPVVGAPGVPGVPDPSSGPGQGTGSVGGTHAGWPIPSIRYISLRMFRLNRPGCEVIRDAMTE